MEREAMEFGGLRVPSVITESFDSLHRVVLRGEGTEECLDKTLFLLSLDDVWDIVECLFLTDSGTPSHLELTLGTFWGSFWPT